MEQNGPTPAAEQTPAPVQQEAPANYSVEKFFQEAGTAPPAEETPQYQQAQAEILPTGQPARDYSDLDEAEKQIFQRMSNDAYNKLLPIYKEHKELKPKFEKLQKDASSYKDARWYDHENAYMLSPEVSNLQTQYNNLQFEEKYWQDQLAKLRAGQPANRLIIQNNQYGAGDEMPAGGQAEAEVLSNLQKAQIYQQQIMQNMQGFAENFKGRYKTMQQQLSDYGTKLFGQLPPELDNKAKAVLESFPAEVRGRAEYNLLSKAAVVINALMARLNEVERRNKVVGRTVQGPLSSQQVPGGQSSGNQDVWSEFRRILS